MCASACENTSWSFAARGPGVSAIGGAGGGEGDDGPVSVETVVPGIVIVFH